MQLDVGKIYEGKVTGITKFGAFVELEPGTTGMVHISEVANTFVNEIKDFLTEGQTVKVKVLSVGEDGKISLSIKKAADNPPPRKDNVRKPITTITAAGALTAEASKAFRKRLPLRRKPLSRICSTSSSRTPRSV